MKQKTKIIAISIFLVALIACNSHPAKKTQLNQLPLTAISDTSVVIAEINGGTTMFVVDTNSLKNDWQNFLNSQSGLGSCQINQIQIIPHPFGETKYFLVATGKMNNDPIKSVIELEHGVHACYRISGTTVICTNTAQTSEPLGCMPNLSACFPANNGDKCIKSVTSSVFAIFPSLTPSNCPE